MVGGGRMMKKEESGWHNIDLMVEIRRDSLAISFDFRVEKVFQWIGSTTSIAMDSEQNQFQNRQVLGMIQCYAFRMS